MNPATLGWPSIESLAFSATLILLVISLLYLLIYSPTLVDMREAGAGASYC
jgi:hypothetical protein